MNNAVDVLYAIRNKTTDQAAADTADEIPDEVPLFRIEHFSFEVPLTEGRLAVVVNERDGEYPGLIITDFPEGSRAVEQGLLQRRDEIVSMNGVDLKGKRIDDVVAVLEGCADELINIQVHRRIYEDVFETPVTRDENGKWAEKSGTIFGSKREKRTPLTELGYLSANVALYLQDQAKAVDIEEKVHKPDIVKALQLLDQAATFIRQYLLKYERKSKTWRYLRRGKYNKRFGEYAKALVYRKEQLIKELFSVSAYETLKPTKKPANSQAPTNRRKFNGKFTYEGGDCYEGYFYDGLRTSNGSIMAGPTKGNYKFKCGDRYIGMFTANAFNGKGLYTFISGNLYEGDFVNGRRHGKGTAVFASKAVYTGLWANDQFEGAGTFRFSNGDVYSGGFLKNRITGTGTLKYNGNGNVYSGAFVNGKQTGKGRFVWANGNVYEGDFFDGKRVGYGVMKHKVIIIIIIIIITIIIIIIIIIITITIIRTATPTAASGATTSSRGGAPWRTLTAISTKGTGNRTSATARAGTRGGPAASTRAPMRTTRSVVAACSGGATATTSRAFSTTRSTATAR